MKWLMNLLRGMVTLTVEGAYPERLLNLCAQQGIVFWGMEWQNSHTMRLTTRRRDLKRLRQLAAKLGCNLQVGQGVGLPFLLGRFRRRYAFLLGLCLSICAVVILSNFVLTIEVVGNKEVSTGEILSELERLGLEAGVYGPNLDRVAMAQQAVLSIEELSWMAINRYGTKIEVIVRERVMTPKLRNPKGLSSVFAEADGIIESLRVQVGEGRVVAGDIVAAGDLLISGEVELESPEYSDLPSMWMEFPAQGEVFARTWRTVEGVIPLTTIIKKENGQEQKVYSVTIFGNTVNFLRSGSIEGAEYDRMIDVYMWALPGDILFPGYLSVETSSGYIPQCVEVNMAAAQTLLEGRLVDQLENQLEEGEEILSTTFEARREGDILYVTLLAECREEIGVSRVVEPTQRTEGEVPEE